MSENIEKMLMRFVGWVVIGSLILILAGCMHPTSIQILSNNNLFTTRSQTTGVGDAEALVEGGGSPVISPTIKP